MRPIVGRMRASFARDVDRGIDPLAGPSRSRGRSLETHTKRGSHDQRCGRVAMFDEEHFGEDSWISLFLGQNLDPQDYDPLADVLDVGEVRAALLRMRSMITDAVATLPTHSRFLGEQRA